MGGKKAQQQRLKQMQASEPPLAPQAPINIWGVTNAVTHLLEVREPFNLSHKV
jgi:hypothetical protein